MLRRDTVPLECRAQDARNDSLPGRRTEVRPFFFLGFRAKRGNAPVSTGRLFVLNDLL